MGDVRKERNGRVFVFVKSGEFSESFQDLSL